jgi:NAD(P)-dependent dehydrogenase (short-subunit alcohol dehydrogenase family)
MIDPLGYEGMRVVVTGAASGIGAATAKVLVELGAEVTAIDIKDTAVR